MTNLPSKTSRKCRTFGGSGERARLSIKYLKPGNLRPDLRNARVHPQGQLDAIVASITQFQFTNPILIDEDNVIICGHGRYLAAKAMGLELVPTIQLPGLDDARKRALRLADNKIALNSAWDPELLSIELKALDAMELDFSIDVIGFSAPELDKALNFDVGDDPDDDVIPSSPEHPVTQPGDIWILGSHRVGCGDARDRDFLRKVVGDRPADAAFLDPPYNVRIGGNAVAKGRHREFPMASGEMTPAEFDVFLEAALGAGASVSRDGAVHFVCMDHRHIENVCQAANAVYGERLNLCIWNKSNAGMGSLYRSKHELIFVYKVGKGAYHNSVELGRHGRNRCNVWEAPSVNAFGSRQHDLKLHPTVKPVGLVADAIRDVTRPGELVLDSFLGSGTTLIACQRVGRTFRGLELDPAYVDVALKRWSDLTGIEPVHEATGKTLTRRRKITQAKAPNP